MIMSFGDMGDQKKDDKRHKDVNEQAYAERKNMFAAGSILFLVIVKKIYNVT